MNKLNLWITEWATDALEAAEQSEFSEVNIIEKILRDPGMSTTGSRHRVLHWPTNHRIGMMSRAMHHCHSLERLCLLVKYGRPLKEDNTVFTPKDLTKNSSVTERAFKNYIKSAQKKLRRILMGTKGKSKNAYKKG